MSYHEIFYLIGATFQLIALACTKILWLRSFLLITSIGNILTGIFLDFPSMAIMNSFILITNLFQMGRYILDHQPIALPSSLKGAYKKVFFLMTPRQFLQFYSLGEQLQFENTFIIHQGEPAKYLYFILEGKVRISEPQGSYFLLPHNHFLGEMGYLIQGNYSKDGIAEGSVTVIRWSAGTLQKIHERNPSLYINIQDIIGRDLAAKIDKANEYISQEEFLLNKKAT